MEYWDENIFKSMRPAHGYCTFSS